MPDTRRNRITVEDDDWKAHVEGRITGLETSVEGLKIQVAGVSSKIETATNSIFNRIDDLSSSVSDSRAINWPLAVSIIVGAVSIASAGAWIQKTYVDMSVMPIIERITEVNSRIDADREHWVSLRKEQFEKRDMAIEFNNKRIDLLEQWAQEYRDRNESGNARQWEKLNNIERELYGNPGTSGYRKSKTPDVGDGVSK